MTHRAKWAALAAAGLALVAPHARAACTVAKIATLPITMEGAQPIMPAKINGVDVRLIVDSGAYFSMLDYAKASELKLSKEPLPIWYQVRGVAGGADAYLTTVKGFGIAGQTVKNIQFLVASFGGDQRAAGLLGQNVLGLRDAEYDFQDGVINLWDPHGCGQFVMTYWDKKGSYSEIPIEARDERQTQTVGEVYLNGKRMRAIFDTGAGGTVVKRSAAVAAGVKIDDDGVVAEGRSGGIGGHTMRAWSAPFDTVKIGDEEVRHVRLSVAEMSGIDVDMLLGADFFISHRIYVANSQRKLYLTYQGGPVFGARANYAQRDEAAHTEHAAEAPKDAEGEPTDADGFSRRGASRMTRMDTAGALADFDRAVSLAPTVARYWVERARAHGLARQVLLAGADLDKAIALEPANVEALVTRASLRLSVHNQSGALDDLHAADVAAAKEEGERLAMGDLYVRARRPDAAVGEFDQWLAAHPDHPSIAQALNGRCWARAMADTGLDQALKDCNRAVSLSPGVAPPLDSRAWTHLRHGELDLALADFNAALALNPHMALSLYGRGLIERARGDAVHADADQAAARKSEAGLDDLVKAYALALPTTPVAPGR